MIGALPTSLTVGGVAHPIHSDYRRALAILQAYGDRALSDYDKLRVMHELLYERDVPMNDESHTQAIWFLDIGGGGGKSNGSRPRTMDFAHDEHLIFAAVNALVGRDVRADQYMHWWTFYGFCQSISPDSLISHIIHIRHKRGCGEKLEKHEEKFYRENQHLIDIPGQVEEYDATLQFLRGE